MSAAGSGGIRSVIRIEPTRDADLRNALAIEQANTQMLTAVIRQQSTTIEQQKLMIQRMQYRSPN